MGMLLTSLLVAVWLIFTLGGGGGETAPLATDVLVGDLAQRHLAAESCNPFCTAAPEEAVDPTSLQAGDQ